MSKATSNAHDWPCGEPDTYGWRGEACRKYPTAASEITTLREQVKKLKAELKSIDGALDDPRANLTLTTSEIIWELKVQVEKLTEESVVLRASSRSKLETIANLEWQVEKLTKQLAALAEQNEKLRKVLLRLACLGNGDQYGNSIGNCIAQEALSLPDLASPVLNRIRAEAIEEAAKIANEHEGVAWAVSAIRNRKAELEKTNG